MLASAVLLDTNKQTLTQIIYIDTYCVNVKVLMKYMEMMGQDSDSVSNLSKKLSPPLVTLLSSEPEVIR